MLVGFFELLFKAFELALGVFYLSLVCSVCFFANIAAFIALLYIGLRFFESFQLFSAGLDSLCEELLLLLP